VISRAPGSQRKAMTAATSSSSETRRSRFANVDRHPVRTEFPRHAAGERGQRRLVQSAAIVHHRLIEDSTRDDFDRVLAVNLVGPFIGMLAVLPSMQRARRGVIINVGSAVSMSGVGGRGLYGASKWGCAV
jgi:NAD(P)-dependent dehydrogenase (short-subunit alcohol dehydrogenase family)